MTVSSGRARFLRVLFRGDGMLLQSALVFIGSMVLNVGGFAFHALASRMLGVVTYGTLYTLISLVTVMLLPGALLAPVVSRFAAEFATLHDSDHLRSLVSDLARFSAVAVALYAVVALLFAIPASAYLGVPAWSILTAGLIAAAGFVSGILRAVSRGVQDFGAYALSATAEGVVKVVALLALGALGLRLLSGILGFFVGILAGLAVIAWQVTYRYRGAVTQRIRYDWARIASSSAGSAAMIFAITCIGSVDIIVVKHVFSPHDAGLYSAAALGGKVAFYLVAFIPMVMLPRVTQRHVRGESTRAAFSESLGLLAVLAAGALVAFGFFGQALLNALVGGAFEAATPLLLPYAAAMMLLAITNLLASYGLATHRLNFAIPLAAGTLVTLVNISLMHPSIYAVAWELLAGNALMCAVVAVALIWRHGPVL